MDYKERFRNTLKRLKSGSNIARYNTICTLTQNDDEQRVWAICREFWGNNEAPLNIENYDVKDLDAAYAKRLLNELESLLDKMGWAKIKHLALVTQQCYTEITIKEKRLTAYAQNQRQQKQAQSGQRLCIPDCRKAVYHRISQHGNYVYHCEH